MKHRLAGIIALACLGLLAGCGTTRWSDTARTGTEQLLVSTAIDRAVDNIDFSPLAGKDVFFDEQYLKGIMGAPPVPGAAPGPRSDDNYLASTLRQNLLAAGVALKADRKEATYIVEARSGAIGTNRHDVMLGVPALSLPVVGALGIPSAIPEIPLAKTTDQKGVAKIALCAYNQKTGEAVWQSGSFPVVATAKDSWFLGAGPWQRGTIYDGSRFAGNRMIFSSDRDAATARRKLPVTAEAIFAERTPSAVPADAKPVEAATAVVPASAAQPVAATPAPAAAPKPPAPADVAKALAATAIAPHPHSDSPPPVRIIRLPAVDRKLYGDAPFVVASDEMDEEELPQQPPAEKPVAGPEEEPRRFQPQGRSRLLQPDRWSDSPGE